MPSLQEVDKHAILAVQNLWMKDNEEIIKLILNNDTSIKDPEILETYVQEIVDNLDTQQHFVFTITITSGIIGKCFIIFDLDTLSKIVDVIIGGDGSTVLKEFDEMSQSVLSEVINQMTGSLTSILSEKLGRKLNARISEPKKPEVQLFGSEDMVQTTYDFQVEDLFDTKLIIVMPSQFIAELLRQIRDANEFDSHSSIKSNNPPSQTKTGIYNASQAELFKSIQSTKGIPLPKINRIKDININFKAVFGRTKVHVKDLFEMSPGYILELDKLPDEPVELYVNNKFIGYGELVVVDENFGIRILEINKDIQYDSTINNA